MIRIATIQDKEAIMEMAIKFLETTDYKDIYTYEDTDEEITFLLNSHRSQAVTFITEGGMILGRVCKIPFGPHLMATEVGWWVEPELRKNGIGQQLLDHYEMWARIAGCKYATMVSLDDQLGKFYEKNGYKLFERAYFKVL